MTVKELKEIIRDWPEEGASGDPTEVWVVNSPSISCRAESLEHINMRYKKSEVGKTEWVADLLLVHSCEPESYIKNNILVHKTGIPIDVLGYDKPGDWGLPRNGVVT